MTKKRKPRSPKGTTKHQFLLFTLTCQTFLEHLSLGDWELHCWHEEPSIENWEGACFAEVTGRRVDIFLNPNIKMTDEDVVATGKHEMLELLLAPLDQLARARHISADQIEEARHAIVRRLEKVIDIEIIEG